MASIAKGVIHWLAADVATTTYTVSGLSFQPTAIMFFATGLHSATSTSSTALTSYVDEIRLADSSGNLETIKPENY